MNRTSAMLAVLLGASVIANVVLILRPSRVADDRPFLPPRASTTVDEGTRIDASPGPYVPPTDGEAAEIARLKRENEALRTNSRKAKEAAVATLQDEQEKSQQYWMSVEAFTKAGRVSDDPAAFHRVIQETGDYLELNVDQRAVFADAAQQGSLLIAEARKELEAIGNPLKQAGQSPPDDPQWQQANQRLHVQLRAAATNLRKALDRTKPRQNSFSGQMERWVNVVMAPWRG